MPNSPDNTIRFVHENYPRFLAELSNFLKIPSISTDPDHQPDMLRAAEWLTENMRQVGLVNIQIFKTKKHPIVFGEILNAGSQAPTILVYGHYDVQPAEPLDLWKTEPFSPAQIGDRLYARGASDMKGQIIATLKVVEAVLATSKLPVNIKFLFEGEEEIGSPSLEEFMQNHKKILSCDFVLNPDAGMIAAEIPTIVYALRGLAYFELRVFGPEHDLHSGIFGGVVHNPAQVLCDLISAMHDEHGRVTLPGFYDNVKDLSTEERLELSRLPIDEKYYKIKTGVSEIWGEDAYSPAERVGARPTLEVNGMLSGFTGKGSKTVIPSWAMAKISTRLVPDQNPDEVNKQLRNFLETHAPKTVHWDLISFHGGPASISDRNLPATRALMNALEKVWGTKPVFKREGGSIPVVASVKRILGVESVLSGFGLPDDNPHGPNEKLELATWKRGIDALIYFIFNVFGNF
jgi:acetylornithine deacetylase/succinyl-diaminopimelate desuccinylase-like protein